MFKKWGKPAAALALGTGMLLAGCGNNANEASPAASTAVASTAADQTQTAQTRTVTDATGKPVEIPTDPQRVVYFGSNFGDFLALGIDMIGNSDLSYYQERPYYAGKLENVADVGNPPSLEKVLELKPDLIVSGWDNDPELLESFAKIAPTVSYPLREPYQTRLERMSELFGLEEETERWNAQYDESIAKMWQALAIPEGTTASIFAYEGKAMYVMGYRNLSVVLNHEQGFELPERVVEEVVNENESFLEVSEELLSEYAGDYLFVIVADNDEDKQAAAELMDKAVWKSIPAVANKHVYFIDAAWNSDDLLALDGVIEQIPQWLKGE